MKTRFCNDCNIEMKQVINGVYSYKTYKCLKCKKEIKINTGFKYEG